VLVACMDDPGSAALARRVHERALPGVRVLGYGSEDTDAGDVEMAVRLLKWEPEDVGGVAELSIAGEESPRTLRLGVPGRHTALNALAAFTAGTQAGAAATDLLEGLAGFGGVHRRFQIRGREHGIRVFDDYAHHPTEVRAVLGAAQQLVTSAAGAGERGRVVVVFQPHLYSRTETFAAEFGEALSIADEVVVLDVYGAREEPLPGVTGALVASAVTKPVIYQPDLSLVAKQVASLAEPGDVVITMGAGDVTMLAGPILDALRSRTTFRIGQGRASQ
jgi:UDP-N-acetylmuramate--alanine ligase